MKGAIIFLLFLSFLLVGCTPVCETGIYTNDGKCCNYICDVECAYGYVEGSCMCECKLAYDDNTDTGIDDLFTDDDDLSPPMIPG